MGIFYLILAVVAIPIVFFMFTWTVVTAFRLLYPEKPRPYSYDVAYLRRRQPIKSQELLVGVREIREDQRRYRTRHLCRSAYNYVYGASAGLPEEWMKDVSLRRN